MSFTIVPVIIGLILVYLFLLESPLFLVKMEDHNKAIENLKKIAKTNKE